MLSDALYKSGVDQIVKVLVNTSKSSVPTYYYLLNTTVEALKLPFWREVSNTSCWYHRVIKISMAKKIISIFYTVSHYVGSFPGRN